MEWLTNAIFDKKMPKVLDFGPVLAVWGLEMPFFRYFWLHVLGVATFRARKDWRAASTFAKATVDKRGDIGAPKDRANAKPRSHVPCEKGAREL